MKINVTLNSLYKWAKIEENYEIDVNAEEIENILDYFGVEKFEYIPENDLGSLVLNGFGKCVSKKIIDLQSCKEDSIANVEILKD